MKIKNKILVIISIIIFALFMGGTVSFASDGISGNNITINDNTYTLPDWFFSKEYRLFYHMSGYYPGDTGSYRHCVIVACSDSPLSIKYSSGKHTLTSSSTILCYREGLSGYDEYTMDDLKVSSSVSSSSTNYRLNYLNYEGNPGVPCNEYYCYNFYSNYDVFDNSGNLVFQQFSVVPDVPILENPTIGNSSTSWDTGIYDYISVYSNDIVGENWRDFYLLAYDYSTDTEENPSLYPKKVIAIQNGVSSKYYTRTDDDYGYVFMVPTLDLGLSFKNGNNYSLKLAFKETEEYEGEQIEYYDYVHIYRFTVANLTDEEIMQDKQDVTNNLLQEQQEILKEQHNTSKGIFSTIKEILSYLNPFSENFFAYKLVGLILDGLKSLFVPSDGFFETFFEDMKEWFSERLGFLFYPFELIIDILNKILNVNFSEPIFNIPDINEPFTNTKLIGATTYNLNSLLSNSILENVHNIYLIVVDSIIVFALVNLAKRKFEEVTSK